MCHKRNQNIRFFGLSLHIFHQIQFEDQLYSLNISTKLSGVKCTSRYQLLLPDINKNLKKVRKLLHIPCKGWQIKWMSSHLFWLSLQFLLFRYSCANVIFFTLKQSSSSFLFMLTTCLIYQLWRVFPFFPRTSTFSSSLLLLHTLLFYPPSVRLSIMLLPLYPSSYRSTSYDVHSTSPSNVAPLSGVYRLPWYSL